MGEVNRHLGKALGMCVGFDASFLFDDVMVVLLHPFFKMLLGASNVQTVRGFAVDLAHC